MQKRVQTGLDRIASGDEEALRLLRGRRVGLLAHSASVDASLRHATQILTGQKIQVSVLFAPEHGFSARLQDMDLVREESWQGIPVHSLYGSRFEDLSPRAEWLKAIDVLLIDVQDVGSRYYTFVWTAAMALKAAAVQGVECVVVDRPNPLGGVNVSGAPQDPEYNSFVGLYPVAARHALTVAEILRWVSTREKISSEALKVIPMRGWKREMLWADTGLPWVQPSPNMPTTDTAMVYPGGCLLEGTRLSEGRGTTKPFEIWGGPEIDGEVLARTVVVPGAIIRPLQFTPMFHKHAQKSCGGVQVHVTDMHAFDARATYAKLMAAALQGLPKGERWRTEPYEFVDNRLAIDLLWGNPAFRECVDQGATIEDVLRAEASAVEEFKRERAEFLLY